MDDSAYNIGSNFSIMEQELGMGAYGKVSVATMDNIKKIAIKVCTNEHNKKYGIPFLNEPIIMKSIIHPYINPALNIFSKNNSLYIFQELARCDMRSYTRISQTKKTLTHYSSIPELKKWCGQLISALSCFHKESLIHADIKAANVLLFYDDNVKLSDFTLCRKKWCEEQKFCHTTGTPTHRSLECWLNLPWEKDLDIWALGCTFFEMAYGCSLFPMQKETEDERKLELERKREIIMKEKYEKDKNNDMIKESIQNIKKIEKEIKNINKKKAINCILDWGENFSHPLTIGIDEFEFPAGSKVNSKEYMNHEINSLEKTSTDLIKKYSTNKEKIYPRFDVKYTSFKLPERFFNKDMKEFNNLIISMLEIEAKYRPKIEELIIHPFITYEKVKVNIIKPIKEEVTRSEQARIIRSIQNLTDEPNDKTSSLYPILLEKVRELSLKIYLSCKNMSQHPENIRIVTSCWIANKVVLGYPPTVILDNKIYNIEEIVNIEEEICNELKFRLHLV